MTSNAADTRDTDKVRLDKWLWAARFFKTRSLASEAISGGKVHVNETRVKPARAIRMGETLRIRRGYDEYVVVVKGLSRQRVSAKQAALLYEETLESQSKRTALAEQRKQHAFRVPHPAQRPSKRDRRHIVRFTNQDS